MSNRECACDNCGGDIVFEHDGQYARCDACRADHLKLVDEVKHLRERQQVHLQLVADMSKQEISPEHAARLEARVASMVAEVGTLRAQLSEQGMANSRLESDNIDRGLEILKLQEHIENRRVDCPCGAAISTRSIVCSKCVGVHS